MSHLKVAIALVFLFQIIYINASCTHYYMAREGDTCQMISLLHGLNALEFMNMNKQMDCRYLKTGTLICVSQSLPKSSTMQTEKVKHPFWDKFFDLTKKYAPEENSKISDSVMEYL